MFLWDKQLADSRTDGTSLSRAMYNLGNEGTWGQPHPLLECQMLEYFMLNFKRLNLLVAKSGIKEKIITSCLLLLNQFCSFLIQTFRSLKLQLGEAWSSVASYWMQRTVHFVGFVVEWFIGMQWAAFEFGKKWTAWLCFFLSLLLPVCSSGYPTLFLCTFLFLPSTDSWSSFSFFPCVSTYNSHFFSLCFQISLLPPVHLFSFCKSLSSLRMPSPLLPCLSPRNPRVDRLCIFILQSLQRLCLLFLLQLELGRMSGNEPDSLGWLVASVTDKI